MNAAFFRFVLVGGIGFIVDGGGTWLLVRIGLSPLVARFPPLVAAIVVTWLLNRTLTFNVDKPRSRVEFIRYGTVALTSAFMNFLIYGGLVVIGVPPLVAVAMATVILLLYSFFAYRHMVFR